MIDPRDPQSRRLLDQVHPDDWPNPVPSGRYNLVVIGGGTAGLVSAAGAAGLGARVALVERHLLGGDCLNVGCVPSKALLRAGRAAAAVRDAGGMGVKAQLDAVDFAAVMNRVRGVRADISPHDSAARFRGLGVDVFFGEGRFLARDTIDVGGTRLRFSKAVIATGGRPALPPVPGLAAAHPLTNETIFEISVRPARLAIIGGGPLGCELAQAFARLGSTVTLVEALPRLIPKDEPEAAAVLADALVHDGVDLRVGTRLAGVRLEGTERILTIEGGADLRVDQILVAAGRLPNIEDLGLDQAGIDVEPGRGIRVSDTLRTSNPAVFAAGDVCLDLKLTHAADQSARLAIQNALFLGRKKMSTLTIPWATYTDPEIARVGLSEDLARAQGTAVDVFLRPLHELDRATADATTNGFVKILVARGSDRILGATIAAPHAADLIAEVAVAMAAGMGLGRLAGVVHPYPSYAEAIRQLGDAYNRTRLTPTVKTLFSTWLRWTR